MAQVTVNLPESDYSWLTSEAAARQATVGELISDLIAEKSRRVKLTASESFVLRSLQNVSNRLGWVVTARTLWTGWQVRGSLAELSAALESLVKKGLLTANSSFTEFQLTEVGFSLGRE